MKTLNDILEYSTTYDMRNFCLFEEYEGVIMIKENIVSRYKNIIEPFLEEFTLDATAMKEYQLNPEKLSARLYGTPHLAWFILYINSYESASDFTPRRKIKLITKDNMKQLFKILATKNRSEVEINHKKFSIE